MGKTLILFWINREAQNIVGRAVKQIAKCIQRSEVSIGPVFLPEPRAHARRPARGFLQLIRTGDPFFSRYLLDSDLDHSRKYSDYYPWR